LHAGERNAWLEARDSSGMNVKPDPLIACTFATSSYW